MDLSPLINKVFTVVTEPNQAYCNKTIRLAKTVKYKNIAQLITSTPEWSGAWGGGGGNVYRAHADIGLVALSFYDRCILDMTEGEIQQTQHEDRVGRPRTSGPWANPIERCLTSCC